MDFMAYETQYQHVHYTSGNIDGVMVTPPFPATQNQPISLNDGTALSNSTKKAIGAVKAAGGNVSESAIQLASQIDQGSITTEQAIAMISAKYGK